MRINNKLKVYMLLWLSAIIFVPHNLAAQRKKRPEKVFHQDKKLNKWFLEARKATRSNNAKKAHQLYDKILDKEPDNILAIVNKGGLFYSTKELNKAKSQFAKALQLDPEYNPELYFSVGLIAYQEKDYATAVRFNQQYLDRIDEDHRKWDRAQELQELWSFKADLVANPVPFEIERLPFPVNTEHSEYTPLFTADGEQLIFVRRIRHQEDLYISTYRDSSFQMPQLIEEIATADNEGVHTISADGSTIIFTACNRKYGMGSCDLYYTYKRKDGSWSRESNMGKLVNSAAWDGQPSLSPDGKTLLFASNRKGSVGGKDIWVTKKDSTNRWTIPRNLSSAINSLGNEETPFLHADGKTLYFRSDGHLGMGGFDAFVSRYDKDIQEWGVPINLGYPINTEGNEGGITTALDGKVAYYASDYGQDNVDLYRFDLYKEIRPYPTTFVKAKVIDAVDKVPLSTTIKVQNINDDVDYTLQTNRQGYTTFPVSLGSTYTMSINQDGYLFHSEKFELDSIVSIIDPFLMEIALLPIKEEVVPTSEPIVLNNVFFETGSATLKSISNGELDQLSELLKTHPSWNITLVGHTDDIGSEEDNLKLSVNRAESVARALVERGIDRNRLTTVGKGESEPISSNETPLGRSKNRRTEFLIN